MSRILTLLPAVGLFVVFAACGSLESGRGPGATAQDLEPAIARGDFPKTTSIVYSRDGKVAERYFGAGGEDVLNNTRSATKSVTALAVGAAISDGHIEGVNDRVFRYLENAFPASAADPAKFKMTIRDLLTMSSALECNDSDPESLGNEENMYPLENWAQWAAGLPADEANAGAWRYCTAGVVLLGRVIEEAVGERVDRYVERRLLDPLGIEQAKWFYSPSGEAMTGGGLELRSRDLLKLAQLILQNGEWSGRQLVSADFVEEALTVHFEPNEDQDYGYLFWRRDYQSPCGAESGWYMAGNGGNAVVMFRDLNAAAVVTRTRYNTRGMHEETVNLIETYVLPALKCGGGA